MLQYNGCRKPPLRRLGEHFPNLYPWCNKARIPIIECVLFGWIDEIDCQLLVDVIPSFSDTDEIGTHIRSRRTHQSCHTVRPLQVLDEGSLFDLMPLLFLKNRRLVQPTCAHPIITPLTYQCSKSWKRDHSTRCSPEVKQQSTRQTEDPPPLWSVV